MTINGQPHLCPPKTTLAAWLTAKGYTLERIAVEYNGDILPQERFASTLLRDADVLEIVNFVGGG